MTIKAFADTLAAVTLAGVKKKFSGIPKKLASADLPAQWVDMPSAVINPDGKFSTFSSSAAAYSAVLYIAVSPVAAEGGLPDTQRTAMLNIANVVEAWAETTPWQVEIQMTPRIPVANIEYRGVTVRVTADDME